MRNAGLEEAQAGIKISRKNISNCRNANDTTLMAESEEKLKSLLMKLKEERDNVGLKLSTQKTKIMASSLITSWQVDGGNNGNSERLYFLGLQNHCRLWLQPWNLKDAWSLEEAMTNLDSILRSRDITLPSKVCLVKTMVFPVVMYGCKSWTIKKAECQRIDAFELWCWRRLLRVPWTARLNQSVLKEINPEFSSEVLMLKLQIIWPLDAQRWLIGKVLDAGKEGRQKEKGVVEDDG